jgi:YHS domain-containing protein
MENDNNRNSQAKEAQQPPSTRMACGGLIDEPNKFPSAIYRGEKIYFCTMACLHAFEQNPDPFMAGEIPHPSDDV